MVLKLKVFRCVPFVTRWLVLLLALLSGGCASTAPAVTSEAPVWVERTAYLMGTGLRLLVAAPSREVGVAASEAALAEVRRLEGVLSSWRADTEVGRINSAPPGEPVRVSAELWDLLSEAWRWRERTGGAFDPAVGALVDAWDLRGEGRRPAEEELQAALRASGAGAMALDPETRAVRRLTAAGWLDTGGFGKGAALAAAERALRAAGATAASLDFGGQVLVFGDAPDGGAWPVAVAHPSRRDHPVKELRLRRGSAATSSQSERWVEAAGERIGHVLDPRTGLPVTGWGSVTAVADDPLVADIVSTAVLVMGPVAGRRWAEGLDEVGVLILEERDGEVVESGNAVLERYLVDHFNKDESL